MPLDELAAEIAAQWKVDVAVRHCDLASQAARDSLITELVREGRFDILVNNAAFASTLVMIGCEGPPPSYTLKAALRA